MVPLKGFAFFAWISFGLGSILYAGELPLALFVNFVVLPS